MIFQGSFLVSPTMYYFSPPRQANMKPILIVLLMTVLVVSCKDKKKLLKDDVPVEASEFVEFFPELKLPFKLTDTGLNRAMNDSALISLKNFKKFIPDTVLTPFFGKNAKPKIYALGRAKEKDKETYLFFKAVGNGKKIGFMTCFNEENQFLRAMPLVKQDADRTTSSYGMLDGKFQITTYYEKLVGGEFRFKRNVYLFNKDANSFLLIMTEPSEELIAEVIDPIDTLSHKQKWTGNYVKDKKNFISFRDSKRAGELLFFIHFEKENGNCNGELKGVARLTGKNTAQYQEPGNPCAIEFSFTGSSVTMKETGGCGTYRDIKCFFEGNYPKKADPVKRKRSGK